MANYNSAKQKAYDVILHLVDNFQNGIKSKNETETRRYYIDKFFEALGWDVGNEKGKREVIHEDIVKVKGKTKFPDYGFYFKGKRVFFVEAKDTKVDIKNDSRPAFQLRSYAWSAKLGVSILTDFEEFAVYDCTVRPKENDRTEAARIKYFTYEDYLKEGVFDYIYDLFERENVANGSLDAYSENLCNRKGSETVDVHFLSTLDELRTKLAVVISKLNREMSEKDINYAVQQIIDRIIFLRVAEDRNVENYGLLALANPKNKNEDDFKNYGFNGENSYYENLNYIFDRANEKYNSGLFDEDAIVRNLNIDDKTIKDIIDELYTPKNPYQFSVIPVEIIGNAYEQFLGKTISIDKNHKAVIELKPEVRKAGGVYYTPEYIVDYIVANTVGEAIKGKTPDEIVNIKILDPACGSGSFLLGAYKYLLNYHKEYFLKNKTKKYMGSRYEIIDESGNLALWVRKQILINNIFGVDIDSNAVEVAKLSLLLKSFEDSFNVNEYGQGSLLNEKILPSLENNIKSGNSLINSNFNSEGERLFASDEDTQYKIKCFSWEKEFSSVIKKGGFDIIIGNPPYVKEYTDRESFENVKKGNLAKYYQGKMDLWYFFVCFGLDILKENGKLGFIAPNNWITNAGASILRNKILTDSKILKYIDFGDFRVFLEAGIQTMVFILNKEKINEDYEIDYYKILNKNIDIFEIENFLFENEKSNDISHIKTIISKDKMLNNLITFIDSSKDTVLSKIKEMGNYFLTSENTAQGIVYPQDYLNEKNRSILGGDFKVGDGIFVLTDEEKKSLNLSKEELGLIKPAYTTEQIKRYYADSNNKEWVIYTDSTFKDVNKIKKYPNIKKHLDKFKSVITSDNAPYGLHRARKEYFFIGEKIISVRKCVDKPIFSYVDFNSYVSATFYVIKPDDIDLKYLTGILNSKLIAFWLKNKGKMQGSNYQIDKEPLLNIPICNTDNEQLKNKLINFVNEMIECNQRLINEKNPDSINRIKNDIADIDSFIDKTVYSIYNISEEERKIIEGE
ncbi:Eco57I restriction-modification methylase domain-containing protein [Brachyspira pilosicoli]|uniref:Eco57I restriction-modification methylase domain-containing protein n=2 Tax=Brachyspira pilosicoli TaxID=52584 RepID=UPI002492099E|nr:N-6 DNA methylase [Brachyspira pilosicoli]